VNGDLRECSGLGLEGWQHVPRRCTGAVPGVGRHNPRVMDLSRGPTTEDQLRIEDALEELLHGGERILHVGVGNSSLARRFASRAGGIAGITLAGEELRHAESLALPGYRVLRANKYSRDLDAIAGGFHFVIDNNPASFGCCVAHFEDLLHSYARLLLPGGLMLTDREGMGWCYDDGPMRLRYEHLEAIARRYPFRARRITCEVLALERTAP